MQTQYLFGPVTPDFAREHLDGPRQAGECISFNAEGGLDLTIRANDTWETVCARLPAGAAPEFIVLYMPYTFIAPCLWSAPIPLVALAADWNLLFHGYRRQLAQADLVLTDKAGVDVFTRAGFPHVRAANLYGCERSFLEYAWPDGSEEGDCLTKGTAYFLSTKSTQSPLSDSELFEYKKYAGADKGDRSDKGDSELFEYKKYAGADKGDRSDKGDSELFEYKKYAGADKGDRSDKGDSELFEYKKYAVPFIRPIDILFVGNMQPAVQRGRLPWLGRLARLSDRFRVSIHQGVFGDEYRKLLGKSRICFNRGIRGECNKRVFEAAAAGALLFMEAENLEIREYFRDRQECVLYSEDDLEDLLAYYLEHEEERRKIAEAGRVRVREYGFEKLWRGHLKLIKSEWEGMVGRCKRRTDCQSVPKNERIENPFYVGRCWAALSCQSFQDSALLRDLARAAIAEPDSANLHNALGVLSALTNPQHEPQALAAGAIGSFRRAVACDPEHLVAGLNLAQAQAMAGQTQPAIEQAKQTLKTLDNQINDLPNWLEGGFFPPGFNTLRVEWERAASVNVGRPAAEVHAKLMLLRWRLCALLGELTADPLYAFEAVSTRPDLASTQALLGKILCHANQPGAAVAHLQKAVAANPFDLDSVHSLFAALGDANDGDGQRRLARDYRRLHQAAPLLVPAESWMTNLPPVGDELTSIIILCCNELEYTRRCLESVFAHTRRPYELILVDNGSSDGTSEYLQEVARSQESGVRGQGTGVRNQETGGGERERVAKTLTPGLSPLTPRPSPLLSRVVVIRNETNLGFPAGSNQGLARATGRFLVLLNNDTVVTKGWLRGMIGWALHEWPKTGMVGPMTNYSREPQQIGVPYDVNTLAGLEPFAAERRRAFAGKAVKVERLTGFCLLVRREVIDQIGVFDERYGIGFFDDDDLCVRALEAGFQLLLGLDVYIHHFGSRTFKGLGVDCHKELRANFEQFKAKWGDERAAGYHLAEGVASDERVASDEWRVARESGAIGLSVLAPRPSPLATVSLCMIVKNEEANLAACLESVKGLFDEIIIVDTGSTDRTKEIALQYGAKVYDFPWCDSFSAARNECLKYATGTHVFWMDGDDRLPPESYAKLAALFASLGDKNVGYVMPCICQANAATGTATVVQHVRLFRNHPAIRWTYRVHEQIQPAIKKLGGGSCFTDIAILHTGYVDAEVLARKQKRDLRLLLMEYAEQPHDPFTLFNLGNTYLNMNRPADALPLLRESIEQSAPSDSIVRKLFYLVVQCHRLLRERDQAVAACEAGRRLYPLDAELLLLEGDLRQEANDLAGAESSFQAMLQSSEAAHFHSVSVGLHGFLARHKLALLYCVQGRQAEAEMSWQEALAEQPCFRQGWLGLSDLLIRQQRWDDLEELIEHMEARSNFGMDAAILKVRVRAGRKEFQLARVILEGMITETPKAVWPRVVLSEVLLQEGHDLTAAEDALRSVLEIAPDHPEARSNLAVLLGRRNQ